MSKRIAQQFVFVLLMVVGLGLSAPAHAETYWLDSRYDTTETRYRTGEEACITGELQRRLDGYRAVSTLPHRYTSVTIGPDNGIDERVCRGQIQKRQFNRWLPVEVVDTLVYGPLGSTPACNLPGLADPDTGQCGVPKCNGNCPQDGANQSNPIASATGNKLQRELDYEGAGSFPLRFERVYNSHRTVDNETRPLGVGWTHSYLARVVPVPGSGNVINRVRVFRPNGAIQVFDFDGSAWIGDADVPERIAVVISDGVMVSAAYTRTDDSVETFDEFGRLTSITNRDGLKQTLSYAAGSGVSAFVQSVTDPEGRTLSFGYTGDQLTSLTDGAGDAIQFGYLDGNLVTAAYPSAVSGVDTRTYHYNESGQTGGVSRPFALTGITDESSARYASWGYDAQRRGVLSVHGAFATGTIDRVSLAFNADGSSTITDMLGKSRSYGFGVSQRVARLASLDAPCDTCEGAAQARTYDANGYPDTTTDFRGSITAQDYDDRGLLAQTVEASNDATGSKRTTQTDWHPTFRVPTQRRVYDAAGALFSTSASTYNTRGQPLTMIRTDPATGTSRTSTMTYCETADIGANTCPLLGQRTSMDGPRSDIGDTTTYSYYLGDEAGCAAAPSTCAWRKGDLWKTTNALGQVTEMLKYNGAGRLLSMKDSNGVVTDMEYHPRGWLTARKTRGPDDGVETDDQITRIEYWPTGLVKKVTQPDGAYTAYTYDIAHRLTGIADNAGNTIHYTLDDAGHRLREDTRDTGNTLRRTLSRVYSDLGRMTTQADAQANPMDATHDGNGNVDTTTDALDRITDSDHDPLNRLARTLQDVGGIAAETTFKYDPLDNPTRVTDPKALHTDYSHNGLSELTRLSSPDTGISTYTYDSGGNRSTQTDARGVVSTLRYDALNRLTAIDYPTASLNVGYVYDTANAVCTAGETFAVGRLSRMTDGSGDTQYCYDRFGHLTRKAQTGNGQTFTLRYAYTPAGRLASVTYPDGAVAEYVRDAQGRIVEIGTTPAGGVREVLLQQATYHPFGPPSGWTYGNGRQMTRTLDQDYQADVIQDAAAGGLSLYYRYDPVDNLVGIDNAAETAALAGYDYDHLNRLINTRDGPTGTPIETYAYDATGNRQSLTTSSGTQSYGYPATSHRLDSVGSVARSYDAAGNTTAIGGTAREFVYDDMGRMRQVKAGGAVTMNYAYNGRGEQVRRFVGGVGTTTVFDEAGHWIGDYDSAGAVIQQAIWMDDLPVGLLLGPAATARLRYIEPDHLGTPRVVIHPVRNVAVWTWELKGEAFGNTPPNQDPDADGTAFVLDMRYPGQRFDAASGLNQNYFRDYDSMTGRYLQVDPLLHSQPRSWGAGKPYSYVESNSMRFTDPFGLFTWDPSCESCKGGNLDQQWRAQIQSETVVACGKIDQLITNVRRAKCIKKSCDQGVITCGACPARQNPTGGEPSVGAAESTIGRIGFRPRKAKLCTNSSTNGPQPAGYGGVIIVHEFAHGCGWDDLGGEGVPDPWADTYENEAKRWGF